MTTPAAVPDPEHRPARGAVRSHPKPGLGVLLAWVGVALAFAYLVFFGGASNFLASPQARILTQVVILAAVAAWLAAAWRSNDGQAVLRTPLLVPGLLYAAVTLVAAAASARPASSLEAAALLLIALPGYLVVRGVLRHPFLRPRLDWLFVLATLGFLIAYLWQVTDQWLAWWSAVGLSVPPLRPADVGLTVGTANAVAVYAELMVAPAAWIAWRRWHSRVVPLVIAVLGAAALLISASRGGWAGAAAGAALVVAWRLADGRGEGGILGRLAAFRRRVAASGPAGLAALGAGTITVVAAAVVVLPVLLTRLLSSDAGRTELWTAGLQIWQDHPLLGGGPGAWPGLRPLTDISIASYAVLYTPHSSLVQVLAETGIAGLVAGVVLVVAVARLAGRSIRSAASRPERIERQLVAACLLALLVHSLVDPMFHIPAVVLLALLLVARLEAGEAATATPGGAPAAGVATGSAVRGSTARPRFAFAAVAAPVLLGAVLLVRIDGAMLDAQRGMDALDAGRPADALAAFDAALAVHDLAPYRVGQGIAKAGLGDTTGAISSLRAAAALEPLTFISAQVAWLQSATDPAAAAATAREAIQAGLYDPAANLDLAVVLARAGASGEATAPLAAVFQDVPELVYSTRPDALPAGLWEMSQALALAEIRRTSPGHAALLEIRAGLVDLAARDLAALPDGPERRLLEQVRAAEAGASPDLPQARADLRADRTNPVAMDAFDRLARLARSDADVRLVQAISIALLTDVPPPDREIRFDGAPGDRLVLALPRWPNASDSRLGPRRPYVPGTPTIQLVGR